jgi:HEAT repeat protein
MPIASRLQPFAIVLIACSLLSAHLLWAQQPSEPPPAQAKPEAQPKQAEPTPADKAEPKPSPGTQTEKTASPKPPDIPKDPKAYSWNMLNAAIGGNKTASRASAVRVLGLMPKNPRARQLAEKALIDDKAEVRTAGAMALGEMNARSSIPKLKDALADNEPSVVLAAAHALDLMHDDSAFEVYYEILTGERKTSKGIIATQTAVLKDPKKLALMGFEEGIGFVPFAGMGWEAYRRLTKTDPSPVRAAAAKVLIKDPDPESGKAIGKAADEDKNWLVRAAALEALARRGDPSLIQPAVFALLDDKEAVKFTAAATVLHLLDVQAGQKAGKKK